MVDGTEGNFDAASIADGLATLKSSDVPDDSPPTNDTSDTPPADDTPSDDGNKDEVKFDEIDRGDIVIRKKRSKGSEPDNDDKQEDTTPSDEDGTPEDISDDDSDDDDSQIVESKNFKELRISQKKYKKLAKEKGKLVEDQEKELQELRKYRDLVDLSLSPEFYEEHKGYREKVVENAISAASLYKYNADEIKTVFEAEDIKSALQTLESFVDDSHAIDELRPFLRDFYVNKAKEEKVLETKDPKKQLQQLREQREARIAEEQTRLIERSKQDQKVTIDALNVLLSDDRARNKMWGGVHSSELSEYISSDLAEQFSEVAISTYKKDHERLVKDGVKLSFKDNQWLATRAADATQGLMANKIIPILLDELASLKKELNIQTSNSNPSIRQSSTPGTSSKRSSEPQTKEEKMLDLVNNMAIK